MVMTLTSTLTKSYTSTGLLSVLSSQLLTLISPLSAVFSQLSAPYYFVTQGGGGVAEIKSCREFVHFAAPSTSSHGFNSNNTVFQDSVNADCLYFEASS